MRALPPLRTDLRVLAVVAMFGTASALGAVGCGLGPSQQNPDVVGNRCTSDRDCAGARCDRTRNVCVSDVGRTEVVFFVAPPVNQVVATGAPTRLAPRTVEADTTLSLPLAPPRLMVGHVRVDVEGRQEFIPATIRLRRTESTPAEPPIVIEAGTTTTDVTIAGAHVQSTFSRPMVPGVYNVEVTPTDTALTRARPLPPFYLYEQSIQRDVSGAPFFLSVAYPAQAYGVSGRIVDANNRPLPDLQVRVVSDDGLSRLMSTISSTNWDGSFSVSLAPVLPTTSAPNWSLEIFAAVGPSATRQNPAADAPSFGGRLVYRVPSSALGVADRYGAATGIMLRMPPDFAVATANAASCSRCVQLEFTVEGARGTNMRADLPQSSVDVRAEDIYARLPSGHQAWYECRVQASGDGLFRAAIVPGAYRGTVTPSDAEFAVTSVDLAVRPGVAVQGGRVIAVERRPTVTGTVTGRQQLAMVGAEVAAVPLTPLFPTDALDAVERRARSAQTQTNATGGFQLPLDRGRYLIVVRPPQASGYAAFVSQQIHVTTGAPEQNIELAAPLSVRGDVVDAAGNPVAEASVTAYARIRGSNSAAFVDVEIADTVAGRDGGYSVLLPAGLR